MPKSVVEIPETDTPLLPTKIRNAKEIDVDSRRRQRERFFEKFELGRKMREEREKVSENSPDRASLENDNSLDYD